MPDRDAHSAYRFARKTILERSLSKMPEHFYVAAQAGFPVACRRIEFNYTAAVSLRIGKTGRPPAVRIATAKAGCTGVCCIQAKAGGRAPAFECKSKTALQAAGS